MHALSRDLQIYASDKRRRPAIVYQPNMTAISANLKELFEASFCDPETSDFLTKSRDVSLWKLMVGDFLSLFLSRTTAHGLVGRGGMFVYSNEQVRTLLRPPHTPASAPLPPSFQWDTLLDIGAGDGGVTARMAPLFRKVYATEFSASMRWRLRRRGYEVLPHETPFVVNAAAEPVERRYFDVIACNNVLDRADKPETLLRDMRDSLKPGGFLVLAVVLPWCPFVEDGPRQKAPSEKLPMKGGECCKGASYEASASKLFENVLIPMGFELVRWTRLPYLCEGNLRNEYALLNDAVFVLQKKSSAA
ncbi:putative mitochondrial DREV methyltransferase [Leptomonas pyrrhocoris]|uniref:Putative mitochondrial DREV methyltransferase n=1 Tax=Leptomonas pyrrhocoris TaxID=157538 RepID=A0A0M9G5V9_LEPPY|nr:putative mitochondrial DREV methyltransferase [Leptomonas pyrrhocoris]KPA83120.1 putative mitochondrial DREV methyltransferase [Leptomonas pyrrhocoris]|eukprot:XP_015661559.1 putative mitochondrial DREV methyltransferase [Leptomonas pyrrhocoris]